MDLHGRLQWTPYQETDLSDDLRAACKRAVHVRTGDGRLLRAGRAMLFILASIGWPVGWLRFVPFVWFVELGYALVAANRKALARWVAG